MQIPKRMEVKWKSIYMKERYASTLVPLEEVAERYKDLRGSACEPLLSDPYSDTSEDSVSQQVSNPNKLILTIPAMINHTCLCCNTASSTHSEDNLLRQRIIASIVTRKSFVTRICCSH